MMDYVAGPENAGPENDGQKLLQNTGPENDGPGHFIIYRAYQSINQSINQIC